MCIMLWYYDNKKFILLFNREEYTARETKKLDILERSCDEFIVGGQDLRKGGTWLAVNLKNGLIACLTNRSIGNTKNLFKSVKAQLRFRAEGLWFWDQALQSRGQLIVDLVRTINPMRLQKIEEKQEIVQEQEHFKCKISNENDEDIVGLMKGAYLNRNKYLPFNLFMGSLVSKQFNTLSSINGYVNKAEQCGSGCNFTNIGEELIGKQKIAKEEFIKIIKKYDQFKDSLINELFQLAQTEFQSKESFFKYFPEDSKFFIKQFGNPKRGTRSTTIITMFEDNLDIFEQTYL